MILSRRRAGSADRTPANPADEAYDVFCPVCNSVKEKFTPVD